MRLDVAYDGTAFSGWASQTDRRTVAGVIEEALATALRSGRPRLVVAGRTDAGVHATGQVAHVDVDRDVDVDRLFTRLAGLLPSDVRVLAVTPAPPAFDARFSALSRRYVYRLSDLRYGVTPLRRHDTAWHRRSLEVGLMNAASEQLLGEHDFAAYCRRREGATTIRRLIVFGWSRDEDGIAVGGIEADAFCHSMVRALVGAVAAVGDGRRPVDWPRAVLGGRVRVPGVTVAPAAGLTLVAVRYPPDGELAARAEQTRRRRGADGG